MEPILDDFSFPEKEPTELLSSAISKMQFVYSKSSYPIVDDNEPSPIPESGCSDNELSGLEQSIEMRLPGSYKDLLKEYRYLALSDSCSVLGIHREGEAGYGGPWLSDQHEEGHNWLVVGRYWRYADGDDLLMDPETGAVYVYLHENEGRVEFFANNISAAVYRMVFEVSDEEYAEIYEFEAVLSG